MAPTAPLLLLASLAMSACTPAGVFTSARPLEPGRVNAYPFLDITGGSFGANKGTASDPPSSAERKGVMPGAGVRVGVIRRLELGARAAIDFAELSSVVNLFDQPVWAVAVAPRVQSAWGFPVLGRAPLLVSYDVMTWATVTPRFGVGYGYASSLRSGGSVYVDQGDTRRYGLSAAFLEGGCGVQFRLGRYAGLALDVYYLRSIGNEQVVVPGGGIALMLGRQPEPRAAAAQNGE